VIYTGTGEIVDLGYGQTMEVLGMTQFTPYGGGMEPFDRAWDDPDLWKKD
jgi:hypothetical protein